MESSLRDFFCSRLLARYCARGVKGPKRAVGADLVGAQNDVSGDFSVAILLRNDKFAVFRDVRCRGIPCGCPFLRFFNADFGKM